MAARKPNVNAKLCAVERNGAHVRAAVKAGVINYNRPPAECENQGGVCLTHTHHTHGNARLQGQHALSVTYRTYYRLWVQVVAQCVRAITPP